MTQTKFSKKFCWKTQPRTVSKTSQEGKNRKWAWHFHSSALPNCSFSTNQPRDLTRTARRAIWEVIQGLKAKGRTIILTTHYLDEAQHLSDRVAIVNHGHIVAMGTSDEIIEQYGSGERLEIHGNEKLAEYIKNNTELTVDYDKTTHCREHTA